MVIMKVTMDSKQKILYVEDDYHNFILVQRILQVFPEVEVIGAKNAQEALSIARSQLPGLILMDIHLPGVDGLDLTRTLKADENLQRIPVVALTANVMKGERERALAAGCNDFMPKPFNLKGFRDMIAKYVSLNQKQ